MIIGTVAKAMSLLALFNEDRLELGLSEIARITNMDKATTHRLLTALKDAGLLEQFGTDKIYRIGPEVLRLANVREASVPMLACAKKILEELSEQTSETTHLSLLRGKKMINVAHQYSRDHAIGIMMGGEDSHPIHATSSGLAVLAFAKPAFIDNILSKQLERFTEQTEIDPGKVREKILSIQALGYAESIGGFEAGVHSFSAPLFDSSGKSIGAISIAAPATRVTPSQQKTYPDLVLQAAMSFTRETGGLVPAAYRLPTAFAA